MHGPRCFAATADASAANWCNASLENLHRTLDSIYFESKVRAPMTHLPNYYSLSPGNPAIAFAAQYVCAHAIDCGYLRLRDEAVLTS